MDENNFTHVEVYMYQDGIVRRCLFWSDYETRALITPTLARLNMVAEEERLIPLNFLTG
jgi:hypothetical protein